MAKANKKINSHLPDIDPLFRSVVDNSLTGIAIINDKFKIIYANNKFFKISGYYRKKIIGQDFRQFIGDQSRSLVVDRYLKRQKGKKVSAQYEIKVIYKNGEQRDAEIRSTVIDNPDGKKVSVVQLLDIADKKQAEMELRESEKKYGNLFKNVSDFIYIHDMDGRLIETNSQSISDAGFDENDIKNASIKDFIPENLRNELDDYMIKLKEKGDCKGLMRIIAKDGEERILEYRSSLVQSFKGHPTVHGIVRDVTELIQTRRALKKSSRQLEKKVEERTQEIKDTTASLKEVNTALKIFWKKKDEAKSEAESKILFNLKELIVPYIDKLSKSNLSKTQKIYIDILRSNLNDIASPFINDLYSKYLSLSPTEIQIANFIKNGKTTKEIANLLNLSASTIESHRKNIRKKIGLTNKKTNLRTHLSTISRK